MNKHHKTKYKTKDDIPTAKWEICKRQYKDWKSLKHSHRHGCPSKYYIKTEDRDLSNIKIYEN